LNLDDELMEAAAEYSGLVEKSAIVRTALQAYVSREATRRLVKLGGTMPDLELPPRKRYFAAEDE
jgi:Arc/MetJ family transcription regulator